jgi:demethylmenaquinone methyltransferase/2-methoxy-6-polyprenyl-1,4-benzoquinol methylase
MNDRINIDLISYYDRRAAEYDKVYDSDDPLRQSELAKLKLQVRELFADKRVLEVACGTGYWTEVMCETAKSVVAVDAANAALRIAQRRDYGCPIDFVRADLFHLHLINARFDGALAGFWLSHVSRRVLKSHLQAIRSYLSPGGVALFFDNLYRPESGAILNSEDGSEDTFKQRLLEDGSEHRVLKNYLSEAELGELARSAGWSRDEIRIESGQFYWSLTIGRV